MERERIQLGQWVLYREREGGSVGLVHREREREREID